ARAAAGLPPANAYPEYRLPHPRSELKNLPVRLTPAAARHRQSPRQIAPTLAVPCTSHPPPQQFQGHPDAPPPTTPCPTAPDRPARHCGFVLVRQTVHEFVFWLN